MENKPTPTLVDNPSIKDIVQNTSTPDWFPNVLKDKISGYVGSNRERLVERIEKTLESGLDMVADEFNRPTFSKFAKLKTEKERSKLLSALGINKETLAEYSRTNPVFGNVEDQPDVSVRNEKAKKELVSQIWKVTAKAWEMDRSRREKENASHDYNLPRRVNREKSLVRYIVSGKWVQEFLGKSELDKMAERIMVIQPGVEDTLREYGIT